MQFNLLKHNSTKAILAAVLSIVIASTGCTAQWISVALADLPVLTQMTLNITTLVTTLRSGQQISAGEAAAIQNISMQASSDLNLLQALYNQYKAAPNGDTLQKIQNTIAEINLNLPALLAAAHIADPVLAARVTVAVNLVLTTVQSFAALLPTTARTSQHIPRQKLAIPSASDLKKQWNQQVCAPTGQATLDAALAQCSLN